MTQWVLGFITGVLVMLAIITQEQRHDGFADSVYRHNDLFVKSHDWMSKR